MNHRGAAGAAVLAPTSGHIRWLGAGRIAVAMLGASFQLTLNDFSDDPTQLHPIVHIYIRPLVTTLLDQHF
jgi:hypothetical protein